MKFPVKPGRPRVQEKYSNNSKTVCSQRRMWAEYFENFTRYEIKKSLLKVNWKMQTVLWVTMMQVQWLRPAGPRFYPDFMKMDLAVVAWLWWSGLICPLILVTKILFPDRFNIFLREMQTIDVDFSNVFSNIIVLRIFLPILIMSYAFHSNFSTQVSPCALVYIPTID